MHIHPSLHATQHTKAGRGKPQSCKAGDGSKGKKTGGVKDAEADWGGGQQGLGKRKQAAAGSHSSEAPATQRQGSKRVKRRGGQVSGRSGQRLLACSLVSKFMICDVMPADGQMYVKRVPSGEVTAP